MISMLKRPFPSWFLPLFQNDSVQNHSYGNVFRLEVHFHVNQTQRFCTRTRFETEAQGNSDFQSEE